MDDGRITKILTDKLEPHYYKIKKQIKLNPVK